MGYCYFGSISSQCDMVDAVEHGDRLREWALLVGTIMIIGFFGTRWSDKTLPPFTIGKVS